MLDGVGDDWTEEVAIERLRVIENNLTPLVVVAAAAGLLAPSVGVALSSAVTPCWRC